MIQSSKKRETRRIRELRKEYEAEGFQVVINPDSRTLPDELRSFQPDMIARKDQEVVVFEIKNSEDLTRSPYLSSMAEQIGKLPGWRFELVITNPRYPEEMTNIESIEKRLSDARELLDSGYFEASVLLVWSVLETTLRLIARRENLIPKIYTPESLIKLLYSKGLLDEEQFAECDKIAQNRNVIAHGAEYEELKKIDISRQIDFVSKILTSQNL